MIGYHYTYFARKSIPRFFTIRSESCLDPASQLTPAPMNFFQNFFEFVCHCDRENLKHSKIFWIRLELDEWTIVDCSLRFLKHFISD